MAGIATGGQTLTPNPNVNAPAGYGGDLWGANGGGITPIGNGVTGIDGWDERVAATFSDGQTQANIQQSGSMGNSFLSKISSAAITPKTPNVQGTTGTTMQRFDDSITVVGYNG
jgi:hypothetical protein